MKKKEPKIVWRRVRKGSNVFDWHLGDVRLPRGNPWKLTGPAAKDRTPGSPGNGVA